MILIDAMPRKLPRYCVEDVDRYGNARIYLRKPGERKVRLIGKPWTAAFMTAYENALEGVATIEKKDPNQITPGTWRDLCVQYFAHATFGKLDTMTRKRRRAILETTYSEPVKQGSAIVYGDVSVSDLTPKAIAVLRDRRAATPDGANNLLKAIRGVFKWANASDVQAANHDPSKAVQRIKVVSDGHHTWTEAEVNRYIDRHPPGTKAYLALCLLLYGGGRRSDVVLFGPQHIRAQSGERWLVYTQHKGRNINPAHIEIPVLPELAAAINECPANQSVFLLTERGQPFTSNGFGNKVKEWCVQAGLPHCSSHGLRKAGASLAAENGATINQMMAIFGWKTTDMAELYTRKARSKKLAEGGIGHIKFVRTVVPPSGQRGSELGNPDKK